jgi:hypothetical protein
MSSGGGNFSYGSRGLVLVSAYNPIVGPLIPVFGMPSTGSFN